MLVDTSKSGWRQKITGWIFPSPIRRAKGNGCNRSDDWVRTGASLYAFARGLDPNADVRAMITGKIKQNVGFIGEHLGTIFAQCRVVDLRRLHDDLRDVLSLSQRRAI